MRSVVEVLEQTGWTWDIVFVDDGSEDDTAALIRDICAADRRCRAVFHDRNRGRGAAFKTGFAASAGRVTGFLDIDLEVRADTIPGLVAEIERHGADIATGRRHYLLRQTGGLHRAAASWGYRRLSNFLLGLDLEDSETGCKFFRRETAGPIVLASANDGWFWDTEVMARARLAGLRIAEVPVQFLRRADKSSTVRFWRDSWHYLRALHDFRGVVGLSRRTKSPIYWTGHGYNLVMRVALRRRVRTRRRGGRRAHRRRRQRRGGLLRDGAAASRLLAHPRLPLSGARLQRRLRDARAPARHRRPLVQPGIRPDPVRRLRRDLLQPLPFHRRAPTTS